ncbi:MAG: PEGA domain-containing protein [Myxococcales bacterium]|nr:PEGA domain-containing protein [Myxococcales bacterium]MCB9735034.1 PEGA domain-containing protein [Deltaproteobacteria bacterium]
MAALIGLFAIALVVAESVGPKVVAPPLVVAIPIATEATDLAAQARVAEPEARAPTPPDGAAPSTHDRGAAPEVSRHTLALVVVVEPREATVTSDLGRLERVSAGVYALYDVDESRPVALTARAPRHEPLTREVTIGSDIAIETLELVSSEPPPKPTPATGTLRVHARPWAQVTIDGRPHGTTPRDIALPAGRHTVQLCKAAECHTKVVVVPARGSVEVDHSFGAQPSPF